MPARGTSDYYVIFLGRLSACCSTAPASFECNGTVTSLSQVGFFGPAVLVQSKPRIAYNRLTQILHIASL